MASTDAKETLEMADRTQKRKAVKPLHNHIKILVIDDDESVCNTVKALLERHGFQVRSTCSPLTGFLLASTTHFMRSSTSPGAQGLPMNSATFSSLALIASWGDPAAVTMITG